MKNILKKFRTDIINTVIGPETTIQGMLHSQRSMRIEGQVINGEISSEGEIYIGENSIVKVSKLVARDVIVAGEVRGDIEAIKSLQILKTGRVYGNITGDQLKIEEGGIYKGKVKMDIISAQNKYEGEMVLNH